MSAMLESISVLQARTLLEAPRLVLFVQLERMQTLLDHSLALLAPQATHV